MDKQHTKMNHILLYGNYEKVFQFLTDAEVGRLIRGLLHYLNTGKEYRPRGKEQVAWGVMLDQVKRNMEKYEIVCERNRNNAQKYWDSIKNVNGNATGTEAE